MRVLLLSAMLSMLGLQLLDASPRSSIGRDMANRAWHEQARNQLLTTEERLDLQLRAVALQERTLPGVKPGHGLAPE